MHNKGIAVEINDLHDARDDKLWKHISNHKDQKSVFDMETPELTEIFESTFNKDLVKWD